MRLVPCISCLRRLEGRTSSAELDQDVETLDDDAGRSGALLAASVLTSTTDPTSDGLRPELPRRWWTPWDGSMLSAMVEILARGYKIIQLKMAYLHRILCFWTFAFVADNQPVTNLTRDCTLRAQASHKIE